MQNVETVSNLYFDSSLSACPIQIINVDLDIKILYKCFKSQTDKVNRDNWCKTGNRTKQILRHFNSANNSDRQLFIT